MSDFVSIILEKLLNRRNIVSRVEGLERNRTRPSATAGQLGEIAQNTGNLVVDGSIVIVDRSNGGEIMRLAPDQAKIAARTGAGEIILVSMEAHQEGVTPTAVNCYVLADGTREIDLDADEIYFYGNNLHLPSGMNILINEVPGFVSGTYTPTIPDSSNVAASSIPGTWSYIRVLDSVILSGPAVIDPTATGATSINFSLPISSDFSTAFQASGIGSQQNSNTTGSIASDATSNNISMAFQATDTASRTWRIMATYQVV